MAVEAMSLDEPYQAQQPATFNYADVSPHEFIENLWPKSCPLLIRGANIQGKWDPGYWISRYGDIEVMLENCQTGEIKPSTVGEFLCTYGADGPRSETWKLKVC
jgi:hypothetical protein